jgi:hypothetical protein
MMAVAVMALAGGNMARAADGTIIGVPVMHVLTGTYYTAYNGSKNASCATAGCSAFVNVASDPIPCPAASGASCTYEVDIAGLTGVSYPGGNNGSFGNVGNYQFTFDGKYPNATSANGTFPYGITGPQASAFMVTYQVKNAHANQKHSIVINLGCSAGADNSGGCGAQISDPSVTIRVLTP